MGRALPQARAVEVHHRVPLARRVHHRDQLLPGRQHETRVPQRQFQHQRAEGLLEVAGPPRRSAAAARSSDGPSAARSTALKRAALVHLRVGQRVQRHRRVARTARPAAQGDLLRHRAGREERRRLGCPSSARHPPLQLGDDPVAVHVGPARPGRTRWRARPPASGRSAARGRPRLRQPSAPPSQRRASASAAPPPSRPACPPAAVVRCSGRPCRPAGHRSASLDAHGFPTACGQPEGRADRWRSMTRNRPVPPADWNGRPPPRESTAPQEPLDPQDRPARLTVGVVGAGRVGPRAGRVAAARRAPPGRRLRGLRRLRAAGRASCCPTCPLVPPAEVLARADLVLLTVPDDALPGLVEGLAETGAVRPGPAAGAHLRAVRHQGARPRRCGPARCRSPCTPR